MQLYSYSFSIGRKILKHVVNINSELIVTLQDILLLDEMHSEGLTTSKLRPKPEDCYVDAKTITAFWNEVYGSTQRKFKYFKLCYFSCTLYSAKKLDFRIVFTFHGEIFQSKKI